MKTPSVLLLRLLACAALPWAAAPRLPAEPLELRVAGTRLLDAQGRAARLRGVNCAGMEFSSNGEGRIEETVRVAVSQWHANLIRLPLSQDRWFGRAPDQEDGGLAYRALVQRLVEFCEASDVHILLDLHWSDAGEWGKNIGQHDLPDANSIAFWKSIAPLYRDNPAVLFDLYNEPTRITWDQWLNGGMLTETDEKKKFAALTYHAVGMQQVLDAVRATGARNVAVAGGINWSYEVGGILEGRQLSDPAGLGVLYAVHPYPHPFKGIGRETIPQWAARMEAFGEKLPFIVTEFGSDAASWPFPKDSGYTDEKWNREMLATLEARGWNWTAWDFHPRARPCLVSDWTYAPTPEYGVWVRQALAQNLR